MSSKEELISLVEYANLKGIDQSTARQRAIRGAYKTARKLGGIWVIDRNEPHIDHRVKTGKYKDARAKNRKINSEKSSHN